MTTQTIEPAKAIEPPEPLSPADFAAMATGPGAGTLDTTRLMEAEMERHAMQDALDEMCETDA